MRFLCTIKPPTVTKPRPSTHLVEAEDGDLAADVDAWRADAEDAVVLQTILGVDGAGGDGGG